jgi:DNA-binding MarR family transcriptional regulator
VTGLPPSAGLILRQLEMTGPMSSAEVGRALGLDASTVSRQLQPLRREGYTVEWPRDGNRRITEISLSDKGRAMAVRLDQLQITDWVDVVSRLTPDQREALPGLLDALQAAMVEVLGHGSEDA